MRARSLNNRIKVGILLLLLAGVSYAIAKEQEAPSTMELVNASGKGGYAAGIEDADKALYNVCSANSTFLVKGVLFYCGEVKRL